MTVMNCVKAPVSVKGKKVLIMGLGTKDGGVGAALWAAKHGARVTVTDLNDGQYLEESITKLDGIPVKFVLGRHNEKDFIENDVVIKNPGIKRDNKYVRIAKAHGNIVDSAEGVFVELVARPYVGITGTKGKSFTTHLVEHIMNSIGLDAVAAGNNCVSPLRFINGDQPYFVLELSSWQLKDMAKHERSPHVACWLNFFSDHMNYYSNMQDYWFDKYNITRFQDDGDVIVVPLSDKKLYSIETKARKIFFSSGLHADGNDPHSVSEGCYVLRDVVIMEDRNQRFEIISRTDFANAFSVPHHRDLLLAATCCVYAFIGKEAFSENLPAIAQVLKTYKGLPHRYEYIPNAMNLTVINDSAATTPDSVICALDAVQQKPLVLLYGGGGLKNLPVDSLAKKITENVSLLILFKNDEPSNEMHELLTENAVSMDKARILRVDDMKDGVLEGIGFLHRHGQGTFLFSPGCKGYPVYQDLFVRGNLFKENIAMVLKSGKHG
jgi:UDP-N-acetylmuramoylalanine--D-glutamate ligase